MTPFLPPPASPPSRHSRSTAPGIHAVGYTAASEAEFRVTPYCFHDERRQPPRSPYREDYGVCNVGCQIRLPGNIQMFGQIMPKRVPPRFRMPLPTPLFILQHASRPLNKASCSSSLRRAQQEGDAGRPWLTTAETHPSCHPFPVPSPLLPSPSPLPLLVPPSLPLP